MSDLIKPQGNISSEGILDASVFQNLSPSALAAAMNVPVPPAFGALPNPHQGMGITPSPLSSLVASIGERTPPSFPPPTLPPSPPARAPLYPTSIMRDNMTHSFHVATWQAACEESAEIWKQAASVGFMSNARLAFTSKNARRDFERWMESYRRRLLDGRDLGSCVFATITPGRLRGTFCTSAAPLSPSRSSRAAGVYRIADATMADDLSVLQDEWALIARHCKGPVKRLPDGWVFERDNDAVLFVLYSQRRVGQP